jgi:hypothetical protein
VDSKRIEVYSKVAHVGSKVRPVPSKATFLASCAALPHSSGCVTPHCQWNRDELSQRWR